MFKTLFLLILLGAAFLGGYHLGRQPGSPDVIGWGKNVCQRVAIASAEIADAVGEKTARADKDEEQPKP